MTEKTYQVTIEGREKSYPAGTRYEQIASEFQKEKQDIILLVKINGKLRELDDGLDCSGTLEFITVRDQIGRETYRRSMNLLLFKAVEDVAGKDNVKDLILHFSMGAGYYYTIRGKASVNTEFLIQVKARMRELVNAKVPIRKHSLPTDDAISLFRDLGMKDKEQLMQYRRVSRVNVYQLQDVYDYYYGFMVNNTKYLQHFELLPYDDGFVLQLPAGKDPYTVPPFRPNHKIFQVQKESEVWGKMMNIDTVGDLNDCISQNKIPHMIAVQEALQEAKISNLADQILLSGNKKIIMIAGPSSSGKTTFSHRLSIQLAAHGLCPHPIAMDNYFVNREDTPLDENGQHDFECLETLDVALFNQQMLALLNGECVELPVYNFLTGFREYRGDFLQLGPEDVLVIEGIHGLNEKLCHLLPREKIFKIYISALTQLNVDEHNRIPTTDGRLIRRIVRDARTRGTSAMSTIARWPSVRRGEEKYIFPFQEEADAMFNSALVYELACLKIYAEPLLFGIPKDAPEYLEAKRLLKFFDYFLPVPADQIPKNSILREFIGGSTFPV